MSKARETKTEEQKVSRTVEEIVAETNIADVYRASKQLDGVARKTSLIESEYFSELSANTVLIKPENLQKTGSFKLRGAYNCISQLTEEQKKKGIITASAGNHAQGVAYAARELGVHAVICMPATTPILKVEATRSYGVEVVLHGDTFDDAAAKAQELKDEHGYVYIHPFNDLEVLLGQGTTAMEIIDDCKDVDCILVPIGGGGLISGVAFAIKSLNPKIKVYGVQAAGAPSMFKSVQDGKIGKLESVSTIADGIAVKAPGENTFRIVSEYVDDIVTVTDDEISAAILALMEQQKLVTEGAGAVPVAAVMFNKIPVKGKKVVCLLSGGNIDVTILSRVIKRGLLMTGRNCTLNIELIDKPGQLMDVSRIM